MNEKLSRYRSTDTFRVINTIGVPHAYCITQRHVAHAANHFGGVLSADAIRDAEKHRAKCATCKGKLSYDEHKIALLVQVNYPKSRELKDVPGLHEYLLSIKAQCEQDGYAGFAFIQKERT